MPGKEQYSSSNIPKRHRKNRIQVIQQRDPKSSAPLRQELEQLLKCRMAMKTLWVWPKEIGKLPISLTDPQAVTSDVGFGRGLASHQKLLGTKKADFLSCSLQSGVWLWIKSSHGFHPCSQNADVDVPRLHKEPAPFRGLFLGSPRLSSTFRKLMFLAYSTAWLESLASDVTLDVLLPAAVEFVGKSV